MVQSGNFPKYFLGPQLSTSLMADLHQDMNRVSSFSLLRFLNISTMHWCKCTSVVLSRKCSIKAPAILNAKSLFMFL